MRFWVGVIDNRWYKYLSALKPDEVNFWQPSATPPFTNAPTGLPFFFKLKMPYNHIAGGGYFVTYSRLPLSLAWEVFGEKNGCGTIDELRELIGPLTADGKKDSDIGCTVLANPFFLDESDWLENPPEWSSNIVRGKMYDSETSAGSRIWRMGRLDLSSAPPETLCIDPPTISAEPLERYGAPIEVRPRIGQSSFRVLVTEAYQRRCAITGENTLVALEAAHIVPFSEDGDHDVRNGLLLRADFHRLFDVGLVSVTSDYRIRVSPKIKETWFNGKVYYRLDNQPLSVIPTHPSQRPDQGRLDWHFKNIFQT